METATKTEIRTISGKMLPDGWPEVAPRSEYGKVAATLDINKGELPITKFSYELENGDKRLLYLALQHSRSLQNPQFSIIEEQFNIFKPQLVILEIQGSQLPPVRPTKEQSTKEFGEVGFMEWLVDQHNKHLEPNEKDIEIVGGDIPYQKWIDEFRRIGYSNEDIMVFDILRDLYYMASIASSQGQDVANAEREYVKKLREGFDLDAKSNKTAAAASRLPRSDGKKWSLELLKQEVKRHTGKDLSFDINYSIDLQKMFDDQSEFRDRYIILRIVEALKKYDRVMVLMGVAHPIRQEKALRQLFETPF